MFRVTLALGRLTGGSRCFVRGLARIAGRRHLPGSSNKYFPAFLQPWDETFPHRVTVSSHLDASAFGKKFRGTLDKLLQKYGALLIRGLPIKSAGSFSNFYTALGYEPMAYTGGSAQRSSVAANVYTASVDPPEFTVEPHNEMAYLPYWPHLVFLYCETEARPGCGGENGLTDVRELYQNLDAAVKEKFNRLGVRYWRYLPPVSRPNYPSWKESFKVETQEEAEDIVAQAGNSFIWNQNGGLCFWTDRPAMTPHFRTGEMLWFGQITAQNYTYFQDYPGLWDNLKHLPEKEFPYTSFYGDGSVIEPDVLAHIREMTWKCTKGDQLKQNEVLVFDNMLFSHSKLGFSGPRINRASLACYKEFL